MKGHSEDLDLLIPAWMEWLLPVFISEAATAEEREASYRLRFEAVIGRGWAVPPELPGGIERDEFDDLAIHVCAWREGALLASTRVVLPEPGRLLPTELVYGINVAPVGQVMDIGRTVVSRRIGTKGRDILIGVLLYCWEMGRSLGYSHCCGAFSPAMIRLYKQLYLDAEVIGEPKIHMGEERYPIRIPLSDESGRLATALEVRLARLSRTR